MNNCSIVGVVCICGSGDRCEGLTSVSENLVWIQLHIHIGYRKVKTLFPLVRSQ